MNDDLKVSGLGLEILSHNLLGGTEEKLSE
jgi:hypothetical protein